MLRSLRIWPDSYKNLSQDLCQICSTIPQDPQGIKKDLPNIFKGFISRSCIDIFKDPFRIWCGSQGHPCQDLYHISALWIRFLHYHQVISHKITHLRFYRYFCSILKDFINIFKGIFSYLCKDPVPDPKGKDQIRVC